MDTPPRIRRGNEVAVAPAVAEPIAVRGQVPSAPPPPVMHGDTTLSPVDLPGSTTIGGRPLLWTTIAVYLAAVFLLLTNATAIHGWAVELSPNAVSARVVAATERWEATTDRLGLGTPRAVVHGWWKRAQAARFGTERAE